MEITLNAGVKLLKYCCVNGFAMITATLSFLLLWLRQDSGYATIHDSRIGLQFFFHILNLHSFYMLLSSDKNLEDFKRYITV